MDEPNIDLTIITVTWNSEDRIAEQIASVRKACTSISYEQIVVDNASTDKTVALIQKEFSDVQVIANTENKGFGHANNQALHEAQGRFVLFLNPDMRLEPGSLDTAVTWMKKDRQVGMMSPKLVDTAGNIKWEAMPRRYPKVWEQVALILKIPHVLPHLLDRYHMRDIDPEKEQAVDTVRGSFMLMRREIIEKLGWAFDPRYYIWYEDVDTCREVQRLGYEVIYSPVITAVDYVGQSFKKRTSLWKQKQFTKSMLIYFQKWEPWWKWMWIWLARPIGIFFVWVSNSLHKG